MFQEQDVEVCALIIYLLHKICSGRFAMLQLQKELLLLCGLQDLLRDGEVLPARHLHRGLQLPARTEAGLRG